MLFADIPGLNPVKELFVQAVRQQHVAHGLLLDGKQGGGALALALAFATYINCERRGAADACGECASCVKSRKLAHPDLHLIFPVAGSPKVSGNGSEAFLALWREFISASPYQTLAEWLEHIGADNKQGNIAVEEARNILKKLSLKAYEGDYKILVIWKPELMNLASANALLKVLEEPAPKTLFLLVTDQADQLLTTILSRTQRIYIPEFSDQEVAYYLEHSMGIDDPSKISQVAYLSDGNLSVARKLALDWKDDLSGWFADWMRGCYQNDVTRLVRLADTFDGMPREKEKGLLEYAMRIFRDTFLLANGAGQLLRVSESEQAFVTNFARAVPLPHFASIIAELSRASFHIERNVRAKMVFLDLSLKMAHFFRTK